MSCTIYIQEQFQAKISKIKKNKEARQEYNNIKTSMKESFEALNETVFDLKNKISKVR